MPLVIDVKGKQKQTFLTQSTDIYLEPGLFHLRVFLTIINTSAAGVRRISYSVYHSQSSVQIGNRASAFHIYWAKASWHILQHFSQVSWVENAEGFFSQCSSN